MVRMRCRIGEEDEPGAPPGGRSSERALEEHVPDPDERAVRRAAAGASAWTRRARCSATSKTCSPRGGSSSSASRTSTRSCSRSRTCSGPTRASSTSSSTCSSGPAARRSLSSRWRGRSSPTGDLRGSGLRNFTSLYLEPLPREVMEQLLAGLVPGLPEQTSASRSSRARRAFRCTRSRRCGCCSTAGCSSQDGAVVPADRRRSSRSRSRRRCTR